ncbi:hypothetical protein [Paenibacillus koleovorans]|uniref:hypothetical protein n=1 Tax=Paenibacillus koleovorans TaxID=121608 RepID=UPI000FDC0DBF|nr:hypothetical protein [Paenibacillus koleovorans]
MRKLFLVFLCFCILFPTSANASSRSYQYIDNKEMELTKELLLEIEEKMKTMSPKDAAIYFEETVKKHTVEYVKYLNYSDIGTNKFGLLASPGDTRSSVSYSNSGLYSANSISGIWFNIINSTLSLVLGIYTYVSSILYGVANLFYAVSADTTEQASAQNYYSYRYITYQGEVFVDHIFTPDDWETLAYSHSREIYEHGWGYFIDTNGLAHQSTIDFPTPKAAQMAPYASFSGIEAQALVIAGYPQRIPEHYYGY